MIKVHLDFEKDVEEMRVEGNTLQILEEAAFIVGTVLLETYKDAKKEGLDETLEEYITPFLKGLKEAVLEFDKEEDDEVVVAKARLNKDQAVEIQKILESKNDEELLNFLKKLF